MLGMTLAQAIKKLGGPHRAAPLIGIPRTTINYWLEDGVKPPAWRQADVARIIAMAKEVDQQEASA